MPYVPPNIFVKPNLFNRNVASDATWMAHGQSPEMHTNTHTHAWKTHTCTVYTGSCESKCYPSNHIPESSTINCNDMVTTPSVSEMFSLLLFVSGSSTAVSAVNASLRKPLSCSTDTVVAFSFLHQKANQLWQFLLSRTRLYVIVTLAYRVRREHNLSEKKTKGQSTIIQTGSWYYPFIFLMRMFIYAQN